MKNQLSLLLTCGLLLVAFLSTSPLSAQKIHACVVMPSPAPDLNLAANSSSNLPAGVQKAVALGGQGRGMSNFWSNGGTIRVKFLGGTAHMHKQVARYAREWTRYANVNFEFVTAGQSDIRVTFTPNGSSWSMLGRQATRASDRQATMNFGWFNDRTPDSEYRRTILHEFGHALGLLHEHQNPSGGIPWNEMAVYSFYQQTQGWDRRTTYQNVIAKQDHDETQYSAYDARSIMHYPVDPRLTTGNYQVGLNTELSPTDVKFISSIYPGRRFNQPARTQTRTTTTPKPTQRPTTTTVERSKPTPGRTSTSGRYNVSFSNTLGKGARAEVIELYLGNRKYTFDLREGQRNQQTIRLQLKPGTYEYRIKTASVYTGLQRVWDGQRYVERRRDRTVNGGGSGKISVRSNANVAFHGKYDKNTGRMKVWLQRSATAR